MDVITALPAITALLLALVAVGKVVFLFWREKRRERKKRPRK